MIFSAYWFIFFIALVVVSFHLAPAGIIRSSILAISSLIFYWHFSGPAGTIPVLVLGVGVYFAGRSQKKWFCNLVIILCLLSLIFYKYTYFFANNLVNFFPEINIVPISRYSDIVAPLAISFFVFEFIHYLYDVRNGSYPIKDPIDFVHFAIFFPSLAAGPLKRYEIFLPSLHKAIYTNQNNKLDNFQRGISRFIAGAFKKLIGDSLTVYIASTDAGFLDQPIETRWIIFSAIAMRIYLDFSGYSDMAIGSARMLGIDLPENFNWPYFSRNLSEFWQRWHISLSSWIRDYLYIPLGGNKVGIPIQIINLLFVFLVCGLWHGAAWGFVAWGLFHGVGLTIQTVWQHFTYDLRVVNTIFSEKHRLIGVSLKIIWNFLGWTLTLLFVWAGWLLFFYKPEIAAKMFLSLFKFSS